VDVLVHHEPHELGMSVVIVERHLHEPAEGFRRRQRVQVEVRLDGTDVIVGVLQHGTIQTLLAAKVVVDHPLHGVSAFGDLVDATAAQALGSELLDGYGEDFRPGGIGVPVRARSGLGDTAVCRHGGFCSYSSGHHR
jgi:hypothetical protein